MTADELLAYLRKQRLAVQASTAPGGAPQAAVVGVAISDAFEIVFDTLSSTRKCQNLRNDPRIALVIGWDLDEGRTVQLEGIADEPRAEELERLKALYLATFPDGVERQSWPGITYFRVTPSFIRFSDFSSGEAVVREFDVMSGIPRLRAPSPETL